MSYETSQPNSPRYRTSGTRRLAAAPTVAAEVAHSTRRALLAAGETRSNGDDTEVDRRIAERLQRQGAGPRVAPPQARAGAERARHRGKYRLVRHLGSGRTADVYLARPDWPIELGRDLAVKVMRPEHAEHAGRVAAFAEQARLLSELHHEHILRVCASGSEGTRHYIVMDYLHGETLRAALQRSPAGVPLDFAVSVVMNCAQGLHYARSRQVASPTKYLGLSPAHITACVDGSAKITRLDRTSGPARGYGRAELAYLAPEHLFEEGSDARSEVFTLGVLLYELTTGTHPYVSGSSEPAFRTLRDRLQHADIASPTKHRADLPEPIATVIMTALSRRPELRYRDCLELVQALHEAAERVELELGEDAIRRHAQLLMRRAPQARACSPDAEADSQVITLIRPLGVARAARSTAVPLLHAVPPAFDGAFAVGSQTSLPAIATSSPRLPATQGPPTARSTEPPPTRPSAKRSAQSRVPTKAPPWHSSPKTLLFLLVIGVLLAGLPIALLPL